jgi:hypothetical protein
VIIGPFIAVGKIVMGRYQGQRRNKPIIDSTALKALLR